MIVLPVYRLRTPPDEGKLRTPPDEGKRNAERTPPSSRWRMGGGQRTPPHEQQQQRGGMPFARRDNRVAPVGANDGGGNSTAGGTLPPGEEDYRTGGNRNRVAPIRSSMTTRMSDLLHANFGVPNVLGGVVGGPGGGTTRIAPADSIRHGPPDVRRNSTSAPRFIPVLQE